MRFSGPLSRTTPQCVVYRGDDLDQTDCIMAST